MISEGVREPPPLLGTRTRHQPLHQLTNLHRPITRNELEHVTKGQDQMTSQANFYQIYEELTPILLKLFQKIEEEGTLPKTFCEATVTLIPNSCSDTPRKENYRPVS